MILGIGLDICEIGRIQKNVEIFGSYFSNIILTRNERTQSELETNFSIYLASLFATKEAFYKAFSVPNQSKLSWQDIEISKNFDKKIEICLSKKANKFLYSFLPQNKNCDFITNIVSVNNFIISKVIIKF